jgi:hypothetical protein
MADLAVPLVVELVRIAEYAHIEGYYVTVKIIVVASVGDVGPDVSGLGDDTAHYARNGALPAAAAVLAAVAARKAGASAATAAAVSVVERAAGLAAAAGFLAAVAVVAVVLAPGRRLNADIMEAAHIHGVAFAAIDTIAAVVAEIHHAGEVVLAVRAAVIRRLEIGVIYADTAVAAGVRGGLQAAFFAVAAEIADLTVDAGKAAAVGAHML